MYYTQKEMLGFFYSHEGNKRKGDLAVAMDSDGETYWSKLTQKEQDEIISEVEEKFVPSEGSLNVKNAYLLRRDKNLPDRMITGDWWLEGKMSHEHYVDKGNLTVKIVKEEPNRSRREVI